MFRRVADFGKTWEQETESTLKVLGALTDASLGQAVTPADRTLGRLAWHLATTLAEMMERTGLSVGGPAHDAPPPPSAVAIVAAYERAAEAVARGVAAWGDATLEVEDEMYGERWPRGVTLQALVAHQAHHRGQMTVLMRQAGLRVPGVYGPSREEWSAFGMQPPAV
ncbi:MAG TPA: DinB family protein [Vicinamibacteria bacterium]